MTCLDFSAERAGRFAQLAAIAAGVTIARRSKRRFSLASTMQLGEST
jgi:hypothetical protein